MPKLAPENDVLTTPEYNLQCPSWVPGGGVGGGKTSPVRFGKPAKDEKIVGLGNARVDLHAWTSRGPEDRRISVKTESGEFLWIHLYAEVCGSLLIWRLAGTLNSHFC